MYSKKKHLMVYKEQMNPVEIKGFHILFVEWNPFHIFDTLKGKISIKTRFMSKNRRAQAPCACKSLAFHFRRTSGPLSVHLGPIDDHMRCPIFQFYKKTKTKK